MRNRSPQVVILDTSQFATDYVTIASAQTVTGQKKFGTEIDNSTFEADGTLKFTGEATVWNDINVPSSSLGVGAATPATINLNATNIKIYAFNGTTATVDELHGTCEILHDYKEGTDIIPHIHWLPTTTGGGNVKFQLEYVWIDDNGVCPAPTTISVTAAAGTTAWKEMRSNFGTITGTGKKIGSRFAFRVFRDSADVADTYAANAGILDIGLHYQADTVGSRTTTGK